MSEKISLKDFFEEKQKIINDALESLLPPEDAYPEIIHKAMRYCVLNGGKRIRPILVLVGAKAAGGQEDVALYPACAIELIHTYSLIHDDLPALDNDDLRRGKPTCHKAFGEANAILAGSALLTLAFKILATYPPGFAHAERRTRIIDEVSQAIGHGGMIGGQVVDLEAQNRQFSEEEILYIHLHKTGSLIAASLKLGGILAGAEESVVKALEEMGLKIGLLFQIVDDILNVEGDAKTLGKAVGSDARLKKATYPALFGVESSRERARTLVNDITETLKNWGDEGETLSAITQFIYKRDF